MDDVDKNKGGNALPPPAPPLSVLSTGACLAETTTIEVYTTNKDTISLIVVDTCGDEEVTERNVAPRPMGVCATIIFFFDVVCSIFDSRALLVYLKDWIQR